ncbi:MAG: hypothetical protein WCL50_18505, partial [Spirochaetota bacterium]
MMRFESLREGFSISMGGRTVLVHSSSSPCLFVGDESPLAWSEGSHESSRGKARAGGGRWLRRRFLSWKPLRQFRILESGSDRIAIDFEGLINLEFVPEGELLRTFIHAPDFPPLLRLCLAGIPGEAIYGGGAASGFPLDLQGKKVEVWGGGSHPRRSGIGVFSYPPRGRTWPQPSFLSSDNYWVSVDGDGWLSADFGYKG